MPRIIFLKGVRKAIRNLRKDRREEGEKGRLMSTPGPPSTETHTQYPELTSQNKTQRLNSSVVSQNIKTQSQEIKCTPIRALHRAYNALHGGCGVAEMRHCGTKMRPANSKKKSRSARR